MTIGEQIKLNSQSKEITQMIIQRKFLEAVKSKNRNDTRKYSNLVDVNIKDSDGWTALMYATDNDDKKMINLLIELGADVNIQDDDGQTALMNAIFVNATNSAKYLIKHGANINIKDNIGQTPLMIAALSNEPEVGELLILEGANINDTDNYGWDAFSIARKKWAFKRDDYFLNTRPLQKEINIKRIIHCLKLYANMKDEGDSFSLQSFRELFIHKYGYEVGLSDIESALKEINKTFEDDFLKVIHTDNEFVVERELNVYEILEVKIVEGKFLNSTWHNNMQIILTDKGKFIDNIPNDQFGFFSVARPGYDWKLLEGQKVLMSKVKIFRSRGYDWINYQN